MKLILLILALIAPSAALAADNIALTSAVFVEKAVTGPNGKPKTVLFAPSVVTPGDQLIFILNYRNTGAAPARDFIVTNPMPEAVSYQGSADSFAQVSIDGGRNWAALAKLKVFEPDGKWRSARFEDVTHVRWALKTALPAGAAGKLSFRGTVR
jgi:uncharacterized repeat protein (TIGR01451 family)